MNVRQVKFSFHSTAKETKLKKTLHVVTWGRQLGTPTRWPSQKDLGWRQKIDEFVGIYNAFSWIQCLTYWCIIFLRFTNFERLFFFWLLAHPIYRSWYQGVSRLPLEFQYAAPAVKCLQVFSKWSQIFVVTGFLKGQEFGSIRSNKHLAIRSTCRNPNRVSNSLDKGVDV